MHLCFLLLFLSSVNKCAEMKGGLDMDSGCFLCWVKLKSSVELFCWAKTLKVRSFPAHQASAELMNPHGPAPALWSEHYSRAKQGKKKLPVLLRLSEPLHTHTDHDCGSYRVTEVYATSADPVWYLRRVKSGFAAIWINKHKHAGT